MNHIATRGALVPVCRRKCLIALSAACLPELQAAETPSEIHIVSDSWHGLTRRDGSGLYFDLVRAVYQRRDVRVRIGIFPYARAVQAVRDKKADAWVASFMNEKDFPLYPKWHFDRNTQMVVCLRQPGAPGFAGSADLRGKRVAWLRDFGLDRYIAEPMKVVEVDSVRSAFMMLEHKRIDYFVGAESDIKDEMQANPSGANAFEMSFLMHLGLFLAFANTDRGAALRRIWDEEMEVLHKTDAFRAIYQRAGFPHPF